MPKEYYDMYNVQSNVEYTRNDNILKKTKSAGKEERGN